MLLVAQLIGGVLALYLAGLIADTWGWRTMFYIIGGVGLIVTLLLFKFYNPPKLIKQQVAETSNGRPMKELYKSSFLWMLVVMYFCSSTVHWGFSSWLPSYLEQTRNLNLREVGSLAMIPQACGLIALLSQDF